MEEVDFILNSHGKELEEYLGTKEYSFFFFPGVESLVDKFEVVNTPSMSREDGTNISFYFRGEYEKKFFSFSKCEINGKKLVKFVSPFLRRDCYDFVITTSAETEIVYDLLEEKQKSQNTEGITFPVIGMDFSVYEREIVDFLMNEEFREFCLKRNIPLKRGLCLAGKPGVGKSAFLRFLKAECNKKDIEFIEFDGPKDFMDRKNEFYNDDAKKVFVFEDFDAMLQERGNGDGNKVDNNQVLQSILKVLDGINSITNTVTIITTNFIEHLDSALLRNGRIDKVIKFELPNDDNIKEFFKVYVPDLDEEKRGHLFNTVKSFNSTDVSYAALKGIADEINFLFFDKIEVTEDKLVSVVVEKFTSANKGSKVKKNKDQLL
jgi:SpoVK/Ycf46/Vps4 family AAA+-type ATPase